LAHWEQGALFVHAGVFPAWSAARTIELAREVEQRLSAPDYRVFLATMYGNQPARWSEALTGPDRLRCILNALTRMRYLSDDGAMDFRIKEGPAAAPPGLVPWFDHPQRATRGTPVIFGHWSTLGLMLRDDAICLDTGCLWGQALTALSWPEGTAVQVPCPRVRRPGCPRPQAAPGPAAERSALPQSQRARRAPPGGDWRAAGPAVAARPVRPPVAGPSRPATATASGSSRPRTSPRGKTRRAA